MTMKLQKKIELFSKKYNLEGSIDIRFLDLTSEVGELSKEIIKGSNYGSKKFEKTENLESEIGDVFFSLIMLSNKLNIDLEEALNTSLKKYKDRFSKKKSISS